MRSIRSTLRASRAVLCSAFLIGSPSHPARAADVVSTWIYRNVPVKLWSDPANWSSAPLVPDNTPITTFDARILVDDTVRLDRQVDLQRFEYFSRSIEGSGSITVLDELVWNGGTLDYDGSFVTRGTSTLRRIPGRFHLGLGGNTTLENFGSMRWIDTRPHEERGGLNGEESRLVGR